MPNRNLTFDVRYTESGCLVPVDDPLFLSILGHMELNQRTVSDLTSLIDVPPSTLYLAMNKMVSAGLIAKCPNEGKRNARFMSSSMSIMKSCDVMEMPTFDWMIKNSHSETDSFLAMLCMFRMMGLDLTPIMKSFGRRLALTDSSVQDYSGLTSEGLISAFGGFLSENHLGTMELISFAPFKVRIEPPAEMMDTYEPVIYIIAGFLKQMLVSITGQDILISSLERGESPDDGNWFIYYDFGNGAVRSLDVYQVHPETDMSRFLIVKPRGDGLIRLITNPTEMSIMLAVNEMPVRMYDMAKAAAVTKSTASMYVNKMIKDGFLSSENRMGVIYITANYSIILSRDRPVSGRVADLMDFMGDVKDFDSMVRNMMRFFSGSLKFLGYDTHYIMGELGSVVAERRYGSLKEEDLLSLLNRYVEKITGGSTKVSVLSVTPLSMSYSVPASNSIKINAVHYNNGFLKRMLELIGGCPVAACFQTAVSGEVCTITYTFNGEFPQSGDP